MAGLLGHGDAFVLRDPSGIRPAFWYEDDEVCVVASERPVIQTAFNLKTEEIQELKPGHALIIKKNGSIKETLIKGITIYNRKRQKKTRGLAILTQVLP